MGEFMRDQTETVLLTFPTDLQRCHRRLDVK